MNLIKKLLVLSLASMMFITTACEDSDGNDTEPKAESATISGTVSISGDWPSTGTVYISLDTDWYPTGAPYASTTITADNVTDNMYAYSFTNVAFGTYAAVSVSWLDPEDSNPATNQHIKGVYGGTAAAYYADATAVTVTEDDHEKTGLDFTATF